jgi:hypothetical protein
MNAPHKFAAWMPAYEHRDRRFGHIYRYHSRSDVHSITLCTYILEDILAACPLLRAQAAQGIVAYGINIPYTWSTTGKSKTLDLAIGPPPTPLPGGASIARVTQLADRRVPSHRPRRRPARALAPASPLTHHSVFGSNCAQTRHLRENPEALLGKTRESR